MFGCAYQDGVVMAARGQRHWHVLFDGDRALQAVIESHIDDAETTFANHAGDFKIGQARADGQAIGRAAFAGQRANFVFGARAHIVTWHYCALLLGDCGIWSIQIANAVVLSRTEVDWP
ncbi:hypothetical protein ACFS07_15055 [Undibacterium arcticum]